MVKNHLLNKLDRIHTGLFSKEDLSYITYIYISHFERYLRELTWYIFYYWRSMSVSLCHMAVQYKGTASCKMSVKHRSQTVLAKLDLVY